MTRKSFALTPLSAAIVSALTTGGTAIAQESDSGSLAIEEIMVTATKRELSLQDIPHSIDVLSAVDLQHMGAKSLEATLRALPSIGLVALQPGQNSLVMRGITTGPFEYRTDAQVAVYLDEQPMSSNSQQVGFRGIDIARVENLPGPQGTLFGASSQTGTIRYISNKPNFDGFGGQIEASGATTVGGDPSLDINGILNIPLIDQKLAARIVAYSSQDGGYVDNVFGTSFSGNYDNADLVKKNQNEYDVAGGRIHLQWNISDNWSALLSYVGEDTEALGAWDSDAALGDYELTRFTEEIRTDDWTSASLTLSGDLGFADLSLTYTRFDRDIVYEYDNMTYSQSKDNNYGYYCIYNYYTSCLYYTNFYPSYIFNEQEQERDAVELRLVSNTDSKLQWTVGAYYEDFLQEWFYGSKVPGLENTSAWAAAQAYAYRYANPSYYNNYVANPNQAYPLPVTDVNYSNTFRQNIKQTAVFGELGYDITDKLNIFGGLRWAEFERDHFDAYDLPGGLLPVGDRANGDGSFRSISSVDDTIHKFGVRYQIDDSRMIYALKSQGFRVGGNNSPRSVGTGLLPASYSGDFLDNYEFGLKSTWMDDRLTLNASAFFMEWKDYLQAADFPGEPWWLGGTVNAGTAETLGIEVQLRFQATERLRLSANIFSADAKFREDFCNNYVNGVEVPCETLPGGGIDPDDIEIRNGQDMPNAADTTFFASAYYEVPDVLGGDLWFYLDYYYSSETWNDTEEARDRDIQGLAPQRNYSNLSVGMYWPNALALDLVIQNVTNESGYSYIWTGEADNADDFGDPRYQQQRAQDRPRTMWLTLRKGFGTF